VEGDNQKTRFWIVFLCPRGHSWQAFHKTQELLPFFPFYPEYFKFCFDIGYAHVFGKSFLEVWIDKLGAYLGQFHFHDNKGKMDDHMALGFGEVEFGKLLSILKQEGMRPIITSEAHQESWVLESLETLKYLWPW